MATRRIDTRTLTDIAEAIRAKTGDAAAMTPTEMAAGIADIRTVRMAAGTFSLSTNGYPPVLTHNLGTQKIAVVIYPKNGATIEANYGYRNYTLLFINLPALAAGETWNLDFRPYNSSNFPNVVTHVVGSAGDFPRVAQGQVSPWTSQSNINQGTFSAEKPSNYVLTDDTFKANTNFAAGTYEYRVWGLE